MENRDCEHGRLARSCFQCEDAREIAELRALRAPIPKAQARRLYENSPEIKKAMCYAAFERALRLVEAAHRIERHP